MNTLSIIVPVYNEEGNVRELFLELTAVMLSNKFEYEIIAVDDGSSDGSYKLMKELAEQDTKIKIIGFTRNYGQTAAITAGINNSNGDIIVLIDSDLENDSKDIVSLLKKLDDGFDVVSGWRKNRWVGQWLSRKLPSLIANSLISKIAGLKLHDYGCTLKVYRREVIKGVQLYGEMHRFIPIYSYWQGGKIGEIEVNYRPRKFGKSNYGMYRTYRVLLDILLMKFMDKYMSRPLHFFGGIGFLSFFLGSLSGLMAIILKIFDIRHFVATPLPIFSALFIIVGVQLIAIGIVSEMLMRTYFESQNKKYYIVKKSINL